MNPGSSHHASNARHRPSGPSCTTGPASHAASSATHAIGSGPFKFKNDTRGSTFEGERNPDYYVKDRPYLNGYKFFISPETSVRAAAVRSGRAYAEFRDLPGAEVDAIRKQLGDKITVQETAMTGQWVDAVKSAECVLAEIIGGGGARGVVQPNAVEQREHVL